MDNYVFKGAPAPAGEGTLEKSIAVLPFRNRSDDEADRHFVDGIHDDILTQLSKVASLDKVISRTSTERYRDTDMPIPEIGKALGVATILEGGVQRAGSQVRINVQLIDAAADEHVSAETYDRALDLENLFDIQSEIAREVVIALHGVLSDEEAARIPQQPTTSFAAYEAYSFGRQELQKRTGESLLRAKSHFERAIELDPLSPVLRTGHISSLHALGRTEEARAQALEGIRRNPEFANFYDFMVQASYQEGNVAEYLRWLRAALEINPKLAVGRSQECGSFLHMLDVESAERCVEVLEADVPGGFPVRAYLLESRGQWDEAAEYARNLLEDESNRSDKYWLVDVVFTAGDRDYARVWLEESNPELFGESDWAPESSADLRVGTMAATILYADGEVERANYLFDQVDAGWRSIPYLGTGR